MKLNDTIVLIYLIYLQIPCIKAQKAKTIFKNRKKP